MWKNRKAFCIEGKMENAGGFWPAWPRLGFNKINTFGNSVVFLFRKTTTKEMEYTTLVPTEELVFPQSHSQDLIRIIRISHKFVPKQSHSSFWEVDLNLIIENHFKIHVFSHVTEKQSSQ